MAQEEDKDIAVQNYESRDSVDKNKPSANVSIHSDSSEDSLSAVNPFLDPKVAEFYRGLYEDSRYECRKAFDPTFEWTPAEEKTVLRKLDYRVALTSCILFVALQVDRGNLQQATADNLLNDLGMTTNDYNTGNTVFYVSFLLAELPSQLISKAVGPDIFIPIQIVAWSIVAMSQGAMQGRASFLATRALIGILEGGFIADLVLWLSYFYKSAELPLRLSWFWTTLSLVQIATSLIASGVLQMRGVAGLEGWRWLFILEGIVTFLIGIAGFYLMVPSAVQTKNKLHPKGWFTDREEKIVVNRVLRDDPSKGDMHNRRALSIPQIFKALGDYDLWPVYAIGIIAYLPTGVLTQYLTLVLRNLGFSTFQANLLNIPYNVIHIILLLIITWLSEYVNNRVLVCLSLPLWNIPLMGVLSWWKGSMINGWGTWAVTTLLLGSPYIHAICVAWVSRNCHSTSSRSVTTALYNMAVQLGSIIASNIYRADDAPLYHRGNRNLFILSAVMIPLLALAKLYYIARNKHKEKKWNSMTIEERESYILNTKDRGNKRLEFRFDH